MHLCREFELPVFSENRTHRLLHRFAGPSFHQNWDCGFHCELLAVGFPGYWEARSSAGTGRHLFLGLYKDEETAACHYDRALVRLKGDSALTNFPIDEYQDEIKQHAEAEQVR